MRWEGKGEFCRVGGVAELAEHACQRFIFKLSVHQLSKGHQRPAPQTAACSLQPARQPHSLPFVHEHCINNQQNIIGSCILTQSGISREMG